MYHKKTIYTNCIWFKVHLCKKATKLDSKRLFPSITIKKATLALSVVAGQRPPDCAWPHLRECYNAYIRILDRGGLAVKKAGRSCWAKAPGPRVATFARVLQCLR